MASLPESPRKPSGKDKAKALRTRIDDDVESLAKAVDAVRASDTFKAFLDVQARFHRYSWHNVMLILSQRPSASRVAGFKAWNGFGRHVCKGEHGIMIFAPRPFKKERESTNGDTETVDGLTFRPVYVFDVSQTDGEPLPKVDVPTVAAAADTLLARLTDVATTRGIAVTFGKIADRPDAFGASNNGAIEVNDAHPTGQQAKTLAHELAHEALHWNEKERGTFTHSLAELEAESVAYVVCRRFGLDVEVRASRYIALWGGDAKSLRESLDRIATTARGIIDDAESVETRKAVA